MTLCTNAAWIGLAIGLAMVSSHVIKTSLDTRLEPHLHKPANSSLIYVSCLILHLSGCHLTFIFNNLYDVEVVKESTFHECYGPMLGLAVTIPFGLIPFYEVSF